MATAEEKQALWNLIRRDHPDFASNLRAQRGDPEGFVSIEGYPRETAQWINDAIARFKPELGKEIETLRPEQDKLKAFFSPQVTVRVKDLMDALLKLEAANDERTTVTAA